MVNKTIITDWRSVCLVGAAAASQALLNAINKRVDALIAVDGGADQVLNAGLVPHAVIGDLDSLSDAAREKFAQHLCHVKEQSSTDFEKALTRTDAQTVIAIGFTGGRLDHQLSVLSVMLRFAHRRVILLDDHDASMFLAAGKVTFDLPAKTRISLMPVQSAMVSLQGVRWPFENQRMGMSGFTSPSNEALGGPVTVQTDAPVLLTLPPVHLQTLWTGVARAE